MVSPRSISGTPRRPASEAEARAMSEAVWAATWPMERIRQRSFFTFGMDLLLSLNLTQVSFCLRGQENGWNVLL